jgi:hypothetical protein
VQIAQLVVEGGILRPFLTRCLLSGVPRGMRKRRLLRKQQQEDTEEGDDLSQAHVLDNEWRRD